MLTQKMMSRESSTGSEEMKTSTPGKDTADDTYVNKPRQNENTEETLIKRRRLDKRKDISPVTTMLDDTIDTNELTVAEEKIRQAVMGTLASWMGEMQYTMQQSLNKQFEEVVSSMKVELLDQTDSDVIKSISHTSDVVEEIEHDNEELQQKCRLLEGRLTRAEREIELLKEEMLIQEARTMRDNLTFFNIPEPNNESCEKTLRQFLTQEMKISDSDMAKIRFDRVHRTGQKSSNYHRVIVAKFNPYEGRQIVLNHIKNLHKPKKFGINEQLPREMAERKKQLLPAYKAAKQANKNAKWSLDKLVVEGKVTEIKKDAIKDINTDTTGKAIDLRKLIHHSPAQQHKGSTFQGHSLNIKSQDDIVPALHSLYADSRVARATHNIYAYVIKTGHGYFEHYEDDGEWGAGAKLLKVLKDNQIHDKLVCVTRWYGGTHMGRARFDHIVNAAKDSLNLT